MRVWIFALVVGWCAWLSVAVLLGVRVANDAVSTNTAFSCEIPGHDSQYGTASWSWWPPGEVCRDARGAVFDAPETWRSDAVILLAAGIVVLPAATVVLARRESRTADESSVELDELVL